MTKLKVLILTGRTIDQGREKEYGKLSEDYQKNVAICELDPIDMEHIGITESDNISVSTDFGSVIVKAVKSLRTPHQRLVFMPYGPWVNIVVNPQTHGTGMPSLKGIPAEIEPAFDKKVLELPDLLKEHYGKI